MAHEPVTVTRKNVTVVHQPTNNRNRVVCVSFQNRVNECFTPSEMNRARIYRIVNGMPTMHGDAAELLPHQEIPHPVAVPTDNDTLHPPRVPV
jgi:hypothetical protein